MTAYTPEEIALARRVPAASPDVEAEPVVQFRKAGCADWYDGYPDNQDGGGPYETRTLYTHPPKPSPPATELEARLRIWGDPIRRIQNDHTPLKRDLREAADALAAKDREIAQAWREGWDAAKTLPLTDDLAQARNEVLEGCVSVRRMTEEEARELFPRTDAVLALRLLGLILPQKSPAIEGERKERG